MTPNLRICFSAGLTALVLTFCFARADDIGLPDATDPVAGMGVNIHFTDAKPGELEMISQGGFHWVRTDLSWNQTEKHPGVYDFSAHDRLFASLDKAHLRAICVFAYTNPLYDDGKPTCSDAGRQAFAKWVVAAVTHFKGHGAIWEIWNEPNGEWFWKPKPNPDDYAKLAYTVASAVHDAAPHEILVGPALACGIPWPDPVKMRFLDTVFGAGVLKYWSAVTVHPYLWTGPESYGSIYDASRAEIAKYAAPGQNIALICGESGHNTSTKAVLNSRENGSVDENTQGEYLARTFLFDVFKGIPLTVWYDWHDDSPSPTDSESNFGTVRYEYHSGPPRVYDPKPAYDAAKTYSTQLTGMRYVERLETASPNDYLLSFTGPTGPCIVAWTADKNPHEVKIPRESDTYKVTSFDGKKQVQVQVPVGRLTLMLNGGPQYIKK